MRSQFQHIGIVIRPQTPNLPDAVGALIGFLRQNDVNVILDEETIGELRHLSHFDECIVLPKEHIGQRCDLVISFGGDGTLLSIARQIAPYRVPLIGVNRGSLGFLTQVPFQGCVEVIESMLTGNYIAEERMMLETSVIRSGEEICKSLALNDVVFSRGGMGQMIQFEVFINRDFVYTQRSDGLIISTPTGSTAYALAAGGPILQPTLRVLTLVPVCPQSMSNRPIAVSDSGEIEVLMTKGVDARVHFDGQSFQDLRTLDHIVIRRYRNSLRLLQPSDYNYFTTLRQKLHWGEQLV